MRCLAGAFWGVQDPEAGGLRSMVAWGGGQRGEAIGFGDGELGHLAKPAPRLIFRRLGSFYVYSQITL